MLEKIFIQVLCAKVREAQITNLMTASPPPTRQLYARFPGHLPRDTRDVADLFRPFSSGVTVKLLERRDAAFINFQNLSEASRALKAVHGTRRHGIRCELRYNKPSNTLCVTSVPSYLSDDKAKEIVAQIFSKFGALEREITIQPYGQQRTRSLLVSYKEEKAAIDAVATLQEHVEQHTGWRWELEFYRVWLELVI